MIEQLHLDVPAAERLVKMLAVNVDQHLSECLELLHGHGIPVDERA